MYREELCMPTASTAGAGQQRCRLSREATTALCWHRQLGAATIAGTLTATYTTGDTELVGMSSLCERLPCLLVPRCNSPEPAPPMHLADLLAASPEQLCTVAAPARTPSVHSPAPLRLPEGSHCPVLCDAVDYRQAHQCFRLRKGPLCASLREATARCCAIHCLQVGTAKVKFEKR